MTNILDLDYLILDRIPCGRVIVMQNIDLDIGIELCMPKYS